jgi:hypothetical protein
LVTVPNTTGVLAPSPRLLGEPVHAVTAGLPFAFNSWRRTAVGEVAHRHLPTTDGGLRTTRSQQHTPSAVLATGTDRGNEVLAHVAAILDLPFVANITEVTSSGDGVWQLVRVRWGGSLLERCELTAPVKLLTVSHHSVEPAEAPTTIAVEAFARSPTRLAHRASRACAVTSPQPGCRRGGCGVGSP